MLSEIKGFLLLKNESFIYFFDSNKILKLSIFVILLSYLAGAYQPFINDPNLNFSYTELLIKFIVLLLQGAFIISGFYFLGITFFASNKRVGLSSNNEIINDENYKILTIRRIFQLISFSQLPVIFGLIFTFIGINTFPGSVGFFIFINTILLISLYTKSIYISYGFEIDINTSKQVRYIKSFLIVLFTYFPSTIIFQLFISGLIKDLI
ncbi:MAG: hypothetical protein VYD40_02490 [Chloroflexota bacterium]|jgi:hypothetical protein|nr:hypothetical protein [Chloroflexota bacterium]MEE2620642.1 hypothetical protein [Chloroflexota bacterium]|tara:strand:+ start:237 stop:863 length:627 start_codon:yes stop_codon:yes gene_type:complete